MNALARVTIIIVFTLAVAVAGHAQTSPPSPAPSATSNSKDPDSPPPPAQPARKVGKAEVYYFANLNETDGKVSFEVIGKFHDMYEGKDVLQLEADYKVTGDKVIKPEYIFLPLSSYSSNGMKYKDNH